MKKRKKKEENLELFRADVRNVPELRETLALVFVRFAPFPFSFTLALTPAELLRSVPPSHGGSLVLCGIGGRNGFSDIRHGSVGQAVARLLATVVHWRGGGGENEGEGK